MYLCISCNTRDTLCISCVARDKGIFQAVFLSYLCHNWNVFDIFLLRMSTAKNRTHLSSNSSVVCSSSLQSVTQAHLVSSGWVTNTFLTRFCTISLRRGSLLSKRGRGLDIADVVWRHRVEFLELRPSRTTTEGFQRMFPGDLCICRLGDDGDTTGNVTGTLLRCHLSEFSDHRGRCCSCFSWHLAKATTLVSIKRISQCTEREKKRKWHV